jgi:DNA topoisomerase IB
MEARCARDATVEAIAKASQRLRSAVAVCRKCSVHPHISDRYRDGSVAEALQREVVANEADGLEGGDARVLQLLAARLVASG